MLQELKLFSDIQVEWRDFLQQVQREFVLLVNSYRLFQCVNLINDARNFAEDQISTGAKIAKIAVGNHFGHTFRKDDMQIIHCATGMYLSILGPAQENTVVGLATVIDPEMNCEARMWDKYADGRIVHVISGMYLAVDRTRGTYTLELSRDRAEHFRENREQAGKS